jgi:hypothetical protein
MVRRQTFINKIRTLRFSYKTTQKRTYLYRRSGTTDYISVPMSELLEDEYVENALRQAGLKPEEIKAFLASAKS